jgi:iron complex transport system substrate-binding protein
MAYYEQRRSRLLALRMHVARYLTRSGAPRPRVAVLDSLDPPRAAGLWVPDMIDAAGGLPVVAEPGAPSVNLAAGDLRAAEAIVVGVAGNAPSEILGQVRALVASGGETPLAAMASSRIWCVDYDALFGAPDARLIEGVEALIRMVMPEALGANGSPPPEHLALRL